MPARVEFGIWMLLGQIDRAFDSVEKYRGQRQNIDMEFIFAAETRAFREHPRFAAFCKTNGFTDYWARYGAADALL